MRIVGVRCILCRATNPAGYQAGAALVRVTTDSGVVGYGESLMGLFCGEVVRELVAYYEPLLIGEDASRIEPLRQRMFDSSVWWGRSGAAPSVIGAIETALWDIAGKVAGVPVYRLLSSTPREAIPVYASLGAAPRDPAELVALVQALQAQGFRGLKLGLQFGSMGDTQFFEPRGAELLTLLDATLHTIRQHVGDAFVIGVDGHMGGIPQPIGRDEALAVAQVLERHRVDFFEEPLSYLDPQGYGWLRARTSVPIAGGESLALREGFSTFTDAAGLDLLQPDVNFVGGLGPALAVATLAHEHGLGLMPHAWCGGPGFMANVHFALAAPGVVRLEMAQTLTDLQAATLVHPPVMRDGLLQAPTAPGIGYELSDAVAARFPFPAGLAERASGVMFVPPRQEVRDA
jgi:L-alanine-DL-glutamate epimerase-like enolase superfamily enzyme